MRERRPDASYQQRAPLVLRAEFSYYQPILQWIADVFSQAWIHRENTSRALRAIAIGTRNSIAAIPGHAGAAANRGKYAASSWGST